MKYLIYITALLAFFGCNSFSKFVPEKYFAEGSEREFATAIYNGNSRKIKKMITDSIVDLNVSGEKGFSYLLYAVFEEKYNIVKILLEHGADPNQLSIIKHPDGSIEKLTPLVCVCRNHWYSIKYIKLLVEKGANVNDTIVSPPLVACIMNSGKDGCYCVWDMAEDLYYRFTRKEYDSVRLLESVTDCNGLGIRFEYTKEGLLHSITDSAGRRLRVEHDTRNGRILEICGPHPEDPEKEITLASYEYDADGNMTLQRNAAGDVMTYEYAGRLIVKETWRNGLAWYFEYDGTGVGSRCVHTWGDGGIYDHKLTFREGVTEVLDSHGGLTVYHHRGGLVWKKVDANGGEHLWRYDDSRQLLAQTDPLGNSTLYKYDRWGNCTDSSDPCGGSVSAVYPGKGGLRNRPISVTTPDGGTWEFGYDRSGNPVSRTNPEGAVTRMTYRDGAVASVKDPYGVVTKLAYDRFRNLTEASDSRGNTSLYGYDLLGRCVSVTNPKGAVQKREYDLVGRVVHVLDFDGNDIRLSYDGIDNLTEYRDNVQHVEYGYSGMWKLTRRRDHRGVVNFRYDREERLRRVTNEKLQSYEFTLDAVGNVTAEKGFDGAVRHYLRDRGGRVVRETLPSGTEREYGYDACSRVTRVSYPTAGDPDQTYAYGLSGRLVQASRGESTVEFAYNSLGLPVRETADGNTILRTYDHTGRILTLDSTTGASLRYTRNGYGELEGFTATGGSEADGAGSWESSHRHDTLGFEVERILPGGVVRSFAYDDIGRLVDARTRKDSRTRHMRRYRWGVADRLLSVEDSRRGETRYSYTPTGQLDRAEYPDGREQWRKSDAVGNLYPDPDMRLRRYLSGGRLEQDGEWHCEYDDDGNLTERYLGTGKWLDGKKDRWRYRWNADGSLAKVVRPDKREVEFTYDALGRRLSKSFGTTVTRWVWNGNVPLHQWKQRREYSVMEDRWDTDTERRDMTVWLFDEESFVPMAMIKEGRSYSILTDQLGTPTEAYDAEGNEVWSRVLDMDGNVIEETGNKGMVPFLFQGQYYDRETGLAYNRFRYYSPQMGMYVSQDPIGLAGGMRLYGYIQNTNYGMDVLGLKGCYLKEAEEGQSYKFVLQISKSEYPETTRHIQNAIKKGHPDVVTISRKGATDRRKEAIANTKTKKGHDRDEWPMAMFKEGGSGADIEYILPSDNRGAGSSIRAALSGCNDGDTIKIEIIK